MFEFTRNFYEASGNGDGTYRVSTDNSSEYTTGSSDGHPAINDGAVS